MQLLRGCGHLVTLESVEQGAADHRELRETPVVEIAGDHRALHLDIGDAVVVQPSQPPHLGLRGLQTYCAVEAELLKEELVAGNGRAGDDVEIGVFVGGDDRLRRRGWEVPVEPVLAGAAVEQTVGLEIGHQTLGGDDDGAAGQSDSPTGADPAPEHLIHRFEIAALEEEHHSHEFLEGDRGTRHTHAV